ncbi:MAG: hypothetical protein RIA62_11550 [Cyclobacteriaceae bacterium]
MKNSLIIVFVLATSICNAQDIYINKVWYFGDNQFYIYLNYNEGYDWKSHEAIEDYLGEPRTIEFESSRRSMPNDIAKKYFNMPWDSDLWLFDSKSNSKIGTLNFAGVEYYEDMIESSYIAVFNIDNFQQPSSFVGKDYYCISSNATSNLNTINPKTVNSDAFRSELQNKFGFKAEMALRTSSIENEDITLTLCSFYGDNYSNNSVLMESTNGKNTILTQILQDEYVMWDMIFTPLNCNDKPVLIMEMGVPETDNHWTEIGVFDGTTYKLQSTTKMVKVK